MKKLILLLLFLPFLSSCGTMFMGNKRKVAIQSNVVGPANLTIDGERHWNVNMPYEAKLRQTSRNYEIKVAAEGYETKTVYLGKRVNNMIFLNFLNLGIGFLVDLAAGAYEVPERKYIDIELAPSDK